MSHLFASLSAAPQAAFAGIDVATRRRELERCTADLPGGFTRKSIQGRTFWYYQLKMPTGNAAQIYLGPDDAVIRELIEAHRDGARQASAQAIRSMARAAIEYGCMAIPSQHGRVIDPFSRRANPVSLGPG